MLDLPGILFYLFGAVLLGSAAAVITLRNPIHCALLLVVSFVSAACLWLLLGAEFLAVALVLVYVGAVMVLFLFVVMMLDINLDVLREGFWNYLPMGLVVALVLAGELYLVVNSGLFDAAALAKPAAADAAGAASNTLALGRVLYTDYLLVFQAAAVVLLVAIVAAIALTLRKRRVNRSVEPAEQVAVQAADRLRILKIDPVLPAADKEQQ